MKSEENLNGDGWMYGAIGFYAELIGSAVF